MSESGRCVDPTLVFEDAVCSYISFCTRQTVARKCLEGSASRGLRVVQSSWQVCCSTIILDSPTFQSHSSLGNWYAHGVSRHRAVHSQGRVEEVASTTQYIHIPGYVKTSTTLQILADLWRRFGVSPLGIARARLGYVLLCLGLIYYRYPHHSS